MAQHTFVATQQCHIWHNEDLKREFESIYNEAVNEHKTQEAEIVSAVLTLIDILKKDNGAYENEVPPRQVGIHPSNRGGKKMMAITFQKKGNKVSKAGFTLKLVGPDKAIAFEANGTDVENHTLWIAAEPGFGNYSRNAIRIGSCGCSHINQWLMAVSSNAKCLFKEFAEPGTDKYNIRIRKTTNKELAHALEWGLKWTIIKSSAATTYKELPALIQRALNVEHHIGEGDRRHNRY